MQHKILFFVSSILVSLAGVFFIAHPVFAQGETYTYSGTGSDAKGLGGTAITADGNAFNGPTTFTKVSKLSDKIPNEPTVGGYDVYYVTDSFNLKTATTDYPACRTTKAIIAVRASGPLSGLMYPSTQGNCNQYGINLGSFTPGSGAARGDTTLQLDSAITISPNSAILAQNVTDGYYAGYYSVLGPALNDVKAAYYTKLGTSAPCSSQGCNDTAWQKMVGECWANARTDAAQSASLTAQAIAYATANGKPIPAAYDSDTGTRRNFAICLAGKIKIPAGNPNGTPAVDAPTILSKISELSPAAVNAAGDASGKTVRDAQLPAAVAATPSGCHIDGIGWIICPVINFLGDIADSAYGFLSTNFLETKSAIFGPTTTTYAVWVQIRNIANVLFVIAFLTIIFSQMTSVGISNYGVKKMLPRLIIAAILVNVSYYACQIAVDVSNILGYSITTVFKSIGSSSAVGLSSDPTSAASGGGFGGFIGGTFAVGIGVGVLYLMLGTLIPVLLAAVVALIMILFILVARQALIVILVILSPLAFVAYLLPNTEQWYKKWQKTFVAMLMLFPIIAVVFGGSTLAGAVIGDAFNSSNISGGSKTFGQIIGAAVGILPLFIVPGLLKKSLDSVGTIGAKMNGIGAKLGGSPGQKLSKAIGDSRIGQYKKYREGEGARKRALVQSGQYTGRGPMSGITSSLNRRLNKSKISGAFGDKAEASGLSIADKIREENIAAEGTAIQSKSSEDILKLATTSKNEDLRTAAVRQIMKVGSYDEKRKVLEESNTASDKTRQSIRDGYYASGSNQVFGNALGDSILAGKRLDLDAEMRGNFGSISAETLVSGPKVTRDIARVVETSTDAERAKLSKAVEGVEQSVELKDKITGDIQAHYDNVTKFVKTPTTTPPPPPGNTPGYM